MNQRSKGRPTEMTDAEERQRERKHVFCVNGSPDFLDVLRQLFQEEHYNVTTTNFVPNTFDEIAALQPDVIIVDLVVSQVAGWDLLERLQQEAVTNGIPVIATSTDASLLEHAEQDRQRYGTKRFVTKPFDIDELLETVKELIGKA